MKKITLFKPEYKGLLVIFLIVTVLTLLATYLGVLPTGMAGWTWHGSPWRFDPAKLPKEAKPILEVRTTDRTFVTGVAVPGAVYLPYNALFPYCLTDEKPSLSPFALSLDSAGEEVLGNVLKK